MQRFVGIAAIAALGCWATMARAGNPLQTNDPETPGVKGWEVNISHNLRLTRDESSQNLPLLNINYGRLENDQWKISIPVSSIRANPGDPHWGIGDVQLGWKYRFVEEEQSGWMASIYPQPLLSTGNEQLGLGNGRLEMFLPVQVGKHFLDEDRLLFYAEAAHNLVFEDTSQDTWFLGVAAELEVTDKIELVAEIADVVTPRIVGPDEPFINLGFNYELSKRCLIQTAFGRGLADDEGASFFSSYVGLQLLWGGAVPVEQAHDRRANR